MRHYFVKIYGKNRGFFCDCTSANLDAVIDAAIEEFGPCSITVLLR